MCSLSLSQSGREEHDIGRQSSSELDSQLRDAQDKIQQLVSLSRDHHMIIT